MGHIRTIVLREHFYGPHSVPMTIQLERGRTETEIRNISAGTRFVTPLAKPIPTNRKAELFQLIGLMQIDAISRMPIEFGEIQSTVNRVAWALEQIYSNVGRLYVHSYMKSWDADRVPSLDIARELVALAGKKFESDLLVRTFHELAGETLIQKIYDSVVIPKAHMLLCPSDALHTSAREGLELQTLLSQIKTHLRKQ